MSFELWGTQRIPIIVLSGEVNSGKTLFALTADPATRTKNQLPRTRVWDQEGSAESYVSALNFQWRDTREAVMQGVHRKTMQASADDPRWRKILLEKADVNDSPSASLFRAWYLDLLSVERGQFSVGVCDTFTPLQDGLVEWLKLHPEAFGRTVLQYERASSMFLWPDVKAMLSYILATDCRLRFETFILTVHLKNEWSSGSKTGQRIAEGLDTLDKLATLHLRLDRSPKAKNKEAPRVPSAIVVKERLVSFGATSADDRPILPPRLPEATPDAIRTYIAAGGADFGNLEPGERLPDNSMTGDQLKLLDAQIATDKRVAAEATVEAERITTSRLDMMRGTSGGVTYGVTYAPVAVGPKPDAAIGATQSQVAEFIARAKTAFDSGEDAAKWLAENYGGRSPGQLSELEILGATSLICRMAADKKLAAANEKLAASGTGSYGLYNVGTASSPVFAPTATIATAPLTLDAMNQQVTSVDGMSTPQQRDTIKTLSEKAELERADHEKYLMSQKVGSYRSISAVAAEMRIAELKTKIDDRVPF